MSKTIDNIIPAYKPTTTNRQGGQLDTQVSPLKALNRIQNLAGMAKQIYSNDRDMMQADKLLPVLDELFNICLQVRNRYKVG